AQLDRPNVSGVIYDAAAGSDFGRMLFELIARRRTLKSEHSEATLTGWTRGALRGEIPQPSAQRTEERNTVINYGDKYILKLFRRLESGTHPALESAQFLADKNFSHVPPFLGALELQRQ